jgi:hypothetical protein
MDRYVYPHHLKFGLPRLLSRPIEAEDVIPDSKDIRDAAVAAMQQGIRDLGNDLVALGPVDSASADNEGMSTLASELPDVPEEAPEQLIPRRAPPAGVASAAASSYAPSRHATSVSAARLPVASDGSVAATQFRYRQQYASQPPSVAAGGGRL